MSIQVPYRNIKVRVATCSILPPQINQTNKNFITPIIITPLENQNAAARNRTGGSSMATMNFTTKPLELIWLLGDDRQRHMI